MVSVASAEFENHYPVVVLKKQFSAVDKLNAGLSRHIESLEARYKHTDANASKDASIATEGGYQTATAINLFNDPNDAVVSFKCDVLLPSIAEYLHKLLGDHYQAIRPRPFGWANILRQGDWQRPHMHASTHNLVSGVYYVRVPEEQPPHGCIDFLNPLPVSLHHGYTPCQRVQPQAGMLLLFPPYHMHYVHPVCSTEPRVVIAFDVLAA